MKWLWAAVVAAGIVAVVLVYRSAIEPSRRYSEVLETIRSYEGRRPADWKERDADLLWEHIDWFRHRNPRDLGRRLLDSLHDEQERRSAGRLGLAILGHDGYRGHVVWEVPENDLPPPRSGYDSDFVAGPFGIAPLLFADDRGVALLRGSRFSGDRWILMYAAWEGKASPAGREAVLAFAESDPDLEIRLAALRAVGLGIAGPQGRSLLPKLVGDPLAVVRAAAVAGLVVQGRPSWGRDLIPLLKAEGAALPAVERNSALVDVPDASSAGAALASELREYLYSLERRGWDEGWELSERLGNVLERRAVGEFDEPPLEE